MRAFYNIKINYIAYLLSPTLMQEANFKEK